MSHTFEELSGKTVAELREVAKEIEDDAVKGYSSMHKADLLKAVCTALKLEDHVHHDIIGVNKAALKAKIKELKVERQAALEAHDHAKLKLARRKIHRLKRNLRRHTV
jgi:hypothetical protein